MANFRRGIYQEAELEQTEFAEYIDRTVLELFAGPDVMTKSGQTVRPRDLAREYGFTDTDGRQPA